MAAEGGHIDIVKHLVDNGAKTSIDDSFGVRILLLRYRFEIGINLFPDVSITLFSDI